MPTIAELIEAHRAAVAADEALFDADGNALDNDAAASFDVEVAAYRALAGAQCEIAADVQAKLDYFVNGSVGMRDTLLDCLTSPYYAPCGVDDPDYVQMFIRSLLIEERP